MYFFAEAVELLNKGKALMPIFEYRCSSCGQVFEELVFGDRDKKIPCPACRVDVTEKIPSVIGGITMGGSSTPACGPACAGASACPASGGGGCCPHAN
ncbi:MAG: zinc ribbon domain-containing protein [Chitinispirillaceae bacterium]|jgi:putative FmdB family regulatory protein